MDPANTPLEAVPYGLWRSNLSIERLVTSGAAPMYPFRFNGKLHWFQSQLSQGGRIALMRDLGAGESICMTPEGFNIRTRVHEYGGRCFCISGNAIIFNNYDDGLLYRQDLNTANDPESIIESTYIEKFCGFSDLIAMPNGSWIIAVMETVSGAPENINSIVAVSLNFKSVDDNIPAGKLLTLIKGADFYASPKISNDGNEIAWIEWDHPYMPWDQTCLRSAKLVSAEGQLALTGVRTVCNQANRSVCQPGFVSGNRLLFVSDNEHCNYWNFFQFLDLEISQLTNLKCEFGEAHWTFGQERWVEVDECRIVAVASNRTEDQLLLIDVTSGEYSVLDTDFAACAQLQLGLPGEVLFVAHYNDRPAEIASLNCERGVVERNINADPAILSHEASKPRAIEFLTASADNAISHAYAYFYTPNNPKYTAPDSSRPPLMVMIHGGPTARSTSEYSGLKQYFCSLGYAVVDVNHRGSCGYGRQFRQSLLGNWGEYDVVDVIAAINYVVEQGWVDPDLIFIRGSSAGGYAVLRSLTCYPQRFAGGACYYGIGNLITLNEITHKFESRYTERLIGEDFDSDSAIKDTSRYKLRSPIFYIDKVNCPLIVFQGAEDKVVPPEMSREVVNQLRRNGMKCDYTEYPNEGHGFRSTETKRHALKSETKFFADIIRNKIDRISQ